MAIESKINGNSPEPRYLYPIAFIAAIAGFVFFKYEYLSLPFFWDEAWVYGYAISQFIESGLTILPVAETNDLTRGHPMLFHFLGTLWGKIFGSSLLSLHSMPLVFTLGFFFFLYFKIGKLITPSVAVAAMIYLMANEIFFVQSTLLLPEIMLGIYCFVTLYFLSSKKWVLFCIFLTASLYTKESAIVLFPVILATLLYQFYLSRSTKNLLRSLLATCISGLVIACHFIYQKVQFGWFFFPDHIGFIELSLPAINHRFTAFFNAMFITEFHYLISLMVPLGILLILMRQTSIKWTHVLCTIFVGSTLFWLIIDSSNGRQLLYPGMFHLLSIGISLFYIEFKSEKQKVFIKTIWLFLIGFLLFCSLNFYTVRYCLPALMVYAVFLSFIVERTAVKYTFPQLIPYAIAFFLLMVSAQRTHEFKDVDTAYKYAVKAHMKLADFISENYPIDTYIKADFLENVVLSNARARYINKENEFKNIQPINDPKQEINIISNVSGNLWEKREQINKDNWKLLSSIQSNDCEIEIYSRKK